MLIEARLVLPPPCWVLPLSALKRVPFRFFFSTMLTTPAMASEPYSDDAPLFRMSMWSIASNGIEETSTNERWESSDSGYGATRWPSTSTRVAPTVRPRSEIPMAPLANAPEKPVPRVPAPLAARSVSSSATEVLPLRWMSLRVSTCTGVGVSVSVRLISEPVTTTRCTAGAGAAPAAAWAGSIAATDRAPLAIT